MSASSDFLENALLDHVLGNDVYTQPTTIYLALFNNVTGLEANNPTGEVTTSGTAYARQEITFDPAVSGTADSAATVTFPVATATYGNVTHVAIVDHASNVTWGTNVNVLFYGALSASKQIDENDQFVVTAGNLTITLA
jgi:prolyl oligopeptidase PreP (S9A serine peptidase family)